MSGEKVIVETNLPFKLFSRGKVRDTWALPTGDLLMIATDRISAFDVVVGAIPGKGKILNRMSEFWFLFLKEIVSNHFLSTDIGPMLKIQGIRFNILENDLDGRSMMVERADHVIPVECVVRGYLVGSGWREYQKTGMVCGNKLPPGLKEGDKLPEPIFTPATKAEMGLHDENITEDQMVNVLAKWEKEVIKSPGILMTHTDLAQSLTVWLKATSIGIYEKASRYAADRRIIIADTKLEFGIKNNKLMLIDELLTPDSSRFWPADQWEPGKSQESFDKQYLRDWLISIGWNKKPPAPVLSEEVIRVTAAKYKEAERRLLS